MPEQPLSEIKRSPTRLIEGRHYVIDPETGCWEWQLSKNRGYGHCNGGWAHRVMWVQSGQSIEPGRPLHHRCENPGCINPAHLTPMVDASTHLKHHMRGKSKFTPADVRTIRERAAAGERLYRIAEDYDVHRGTVEWIAQGRMWKDVGGPLTRPVAVCQLEGCDTPLTGRRTQKYCSPRHRTAGNARKHRTRKLAAA